MAINGYPRMFTIVVPDDIKLEHIGDYVSDMANKHIKGAGSTVPGTARIAPQLPKLFQLTYLTHVPYELPEALDIRIPNTRKPSAVEEAGQIPVRNQDGHSKANSAGATKR